MPASLLARLALVVFLSCSASALAAPPPPKPLAQLAGTYDCVHKDWRDTVILKADGTYARGSGDPGTWTFDGRTLGLKWKKWGLEPVEATQPGAFAAKDGHFKLTLRNAPDWSKAVGSFDGHHPDWKDSVTTKADGTYARGSGDGGRWYFDGKTLVLYWTNWGPEAVDVAGDGFANARFKLLRKGGAAAPAVVAVPAPIPQPAGPADPILGRWAWKFPGDESIWGPPIVNILPGGAVEGKPNGKWVVMDGPGRRYRIDWDGGGSVELVLAYDNDNMDGVLSNGRKVAPARVKPPPPPAPPAAPPPPAPVAVAAPPPPPPAMEGNASRMIRTDKRVYAAGEPVVVTYFGMPGSSTDWTNVIKASEASDEWGDWSYNDGANGSRTVKNLKAGEYEARAYFGSGKEIQDKVGFTVK